MHALKIILFQVCVCNLVYGAKERSDISIIQLLNAYKHATLEIDLKERIERDLL